MYDIIVIGSATRDILMKPEGHHVDVDPRFSSGRALALPLGSKLEIKKIVFTTGGGGTNAAVTFARQGLQACCIGVVGKDFNGDEIMQELRGEGIEASYFARHSDDSTAYSVILVNEDAERTILSYKGEGQHFGDVKIPFERLQSRWMYLDSLGGSWEVLENAVNWAVANGVKLATNPGGKELAHGLAKLKPLLKNFSVVMMNQEEAAGLTGIPYTDKEKIFKTMDQLIEGVFVMTKGPEGVEVSDGQQIYSAGIPDSPVVERTGAGDAFNSGFLTEYIRSSDITKAIQFASANASSVVTEYGGKAGILKVGDWGPWPLVEVKVSKLG